MAGELRVAGSSVGLALGTLGLPFVQAALGEAGLRVALVWDLVNTVAGALSGPTLLNEPCKPVRKHGEQAVRRA